MMKLIKEMNIAWQVYFALLMLSIILNIGLMLYLSATLNGAEGLALAGAFGQLFLLILFVCLNTFVYLLGKKWPILRKILVVGLIVLASCVVLYIPFQAYIQNNYDQKYRPLTYKEATEIVEQCDVERVSSVEGGGAQIDMKDGTIRSIEPYISANDISSLSVLRANCN